MAVDVSPSTAAPDPALASASAFTPAVEHLDVLVVGAGISGLNSAYRLREAFPDLSFAILERDSKVGGTWAFWRFPGIRSDSTLAVFGFEWHPWPHVINFAPADMILDYINEATTTHGLDKHIRFRHTVLASSWSTAEQCWTVDVDVAESGRRTIKAKWLFMCSGYYDYKTARRVDIPGLDRFKGEVAHPQFWDPAVHSVEGKRVVVVGSGATAVTMMPHIAAKARHVTMLQRSPSYVLPMPQLDPWSARLRRWLGLSLGARVDWWRRILMEVLFVHYFLLKFPSAGRKHIRAETAKSLPEDYPVDVHFNPRYNPFEQRVCFAPDGDFFVALKQPNCDIATAAIETCDETGIRLKPAPHGGAPDTPRRIDADMIITATGLYMQLLNGDGPIVDGVKQRLSELYVWRSCMLEGLPNACSIQGYTAGTWTPGADVHIRTALAVMRHARQIGATSVVPHIDPEERKTLPRMPALPNNSTYIVEATGRLPLTAGRDPWTNGRHFLADSWVYWFGGVRKGLKYAVPGKDKGE